MLFKKLKKNKNKEKDVEINLNIDENKNGEDALNKGLRDIKDIIAPASIDRSDENSIIIGNKYVRSFVMNAYPEKVSIGWLDELYNYDGDMDCAIYVQPADERTAQDELTNKITQFETQRSIEIDKGNIKNITKLENTIANLYAEREKLEQNSERLFYIEILSNLYADSKEELEKLSQKLDSKLKGIHMNLLPCYLRQDDGYKSALPFGKAYITDKFRNFNSGALTACFPFYNNEIYHETGVYCGVNLATWTPVSIDFYDRNKIINGNITVFGETGSGKTFWVSILTMRSVLRGIKTVIIDPESEYRKMTNAFGGSLIDLATDSKNRINPFDLEEEEILDENGEGTGVFEVKIKDKISDLLNLIGVMASGLTGAEESVVSDCLMELFETKGFTTDPESLYITEPYFDEETGEFYHNGMKKEMPTFSDFHDILTERARKENDKELQKLARALKMFKKGGVYDIFDCHTSENLKNFKDAPIVTFDVSGLERQGILRVIGMYVALSWAWEKFAKKNIGVKKRILCDEAWMLVDKNMPGHEFTGKFLETTSRRIRKRTGGLMVASQQFREFSDNPQGKAVLNNASVNMLLKQNATDIDAVQETFKLSDGERNFLLTAQRGELLIRMNNDGITVQVDPFEDEVALIESKVKEKAKKNKKQK